MKEQKAQGQISRFSARELERYEDELPDQTRRQYFPIRDRYIKIVKNSRKLSIESFEKRGRKDLKQTCKSLIKVAKLQKRQKYENTLNRQMQDLELNWMPSKNDLKPSFWAIKADNFSWFSILNMEVPGSHKTDFLFIRVS